MALGSSTAAATKHCINPCCLVHFDNLEENLIIIISIFKTALSFRVAVVDRRPDDAKWRHAILCDPPLVSALAMVRVPFFDITRSLDPATWSWVVLLGVFHRVLRSILSSPCDQDPSSARDHTNVIVLSRPKGVAARFRVLLESRCS